MVSWCVSMRSVSVDVSGIIVSPCLLIHVIVARLILLFFFQAEDGIRDLVRSRGLGDVYKRQPSSSHSRCSGGRSRTAISVATPLRLAILMRSSWHCLLYTSDAADERSSVDLGGRRIIKKKIYTSTPHRRGT